MANNELLSAVYRDDHQTVRKLLAGPRIVGVDQGEIFARAVGRGNVHMVKYLLESSRFDAAENPKLAFESAIVNHKTHVLRLLLRDPRFDPTVENGAVLYMAAAYGYGLIMDILRKDPRVDPAWSTSQEYLDGKQRHAAQVAYEVRRLVDANSATKALQDAIRAGDVVKVKLLLQSPLIDTTGYESKALVFAIYASNLEMVELLMRDGRFGATQDSGLQLAVFAASTKGFSIAERLLCDERSRRTMANPSAYTDYTLFGLRAMRLYGPKLASVLSRLGISAEASASVLKQALRLTGLKKKDIGDLVNLE
jgi:hypothetical protein